MWEFIKLVKIKRFRCFLFNGNICPFIRGIGAGLRNGNYWHSFHNSEIAAAPKVPVISNMVVALRIASFRLNWPSMVTEVVNARWWISTVVLRRPMLGVDGLFWIHFLTITFMGFPLVVARFLLQDTRDGQLGIATIRQVAIWQQGQLLRQGTRREWRMPEWLFWFYFALNTSDEWMILYS